MFVILFGILVQILVCTSKSFGQGLFSGYTVMHCIVHEEKIFYISREYQSHFCTIFLAWNEHNQDFYMLS